jgi:hypothetical protein
MGRFARGQVQLMQRVRPCGYREKKEVIMEISAVLPVNALDSTIS